MADHRYQRHRHRRLSPTATSSARPAPMSASRAWRAARSIPTAPRNAGIVDLDKAPRNAAGPRRIRHRFRHPAARRTRRAAAASWSTTCPIAARSASSTCSTTSRPTTRPAPTTRRPSEDAGLGFLLGRGYSLVWSGWDPGAPRANGGLGADFPTALENGRPIVRRIRDEFHIGTRAPGDGSVAPPLLPRRLDRPAARRG